MIWLQFIIDTTNEYADPISDCLNDMGALAVTFEDAKDHPLFEPAPGDTPLWPTTLVTGLFDENCDVLSVQYYLKKQLPEKAILKLRIEPLKDQNWVQTSLDQFKPMQFGKRLWVVPSWCEIDNQAVKQEDKQKTVMVLLDPGLAFGTGTHPTTRLCLEWLSENPPENALVIDYGCGSGILSIAAAKLGAKKVIAVDHDPQALQSTKENAKKNQLSELEIQLLLSGDASGAGGVLSLINENEKADLILANILADPLVELKDTFSALLKQNGKIVLSGILEKQTEKLIEAYSTSFDHFEVEILEGWARIAAIKKNT